MAKIQTEILVVKLSRLIKDADHELSLATEDLQNNLETIVQELVGDKILVEIEKGD